MFVRCSLVKYSKWCVKVVRQFILFGGSVQREYIFLKNIFITFMYACMGEPNCICTNVIWDCKKNNIKWPCYLILGQALSTRLSCVCETFYFLSNFLLIFHRNHRNKKKLFKTLNGLVRMKLILYNIPTLPLIVDHIRVRNNFTHIRFNVSKSSIKCISQ